MSRKRKVTNISRVFADVLQQKPQSYWDYESAHIDWGTQAGYVVTKKVGRGKYSEVFDAVNTNNNQECVIKVLKPVKKKKIKREITILQHLFGGPNIVKLYDVVKDPTTKTPSLVFERIDCDDFRELYPTLKDADVRFYMFQILRALLFAHQNGIMHRDIKPHNVLINHKKRELTVIDWGLAEYYHSAMEYNVRVASRYFKGPELLVNQKDYDYSLDIWSLGCLFAGIIFRREPFFKGNDNYDQLVKIAQVLGTDDLMAYLAKYGLTLDPYYDGILGKHSKKSFRKFITPDTTSLCSDEALDLLERMLQYDPQARITVEEAMAHPYFETVLAEEKKTLAETPSNPAKEVTTETATDVPPEQETNNNRTSAPSSNTKPPGGV